MTRGGSLADFDVRGLLRALASHGVDFVVIGGIAAVYHGSARLTADLDVTFSTQTPNLVRLGRALESLNTRLRGAEDVTGFVPDASTLRKVEVLTLSTDLGPLDVLGRPAGAPQYSVLRERASVLTVDEFTVRVADVEDLIAMKRAAGRRKDDEDVAELEAILRLRGS